MTWYNCVYRVRILLNIIISGPSSEKMNCWWCSQNVSLWTSTAVWLIFTINISNSYALSFEREIDNFCTFIVLISWLSDLERRLKESDFHFLSLNHACLNPNVREFVSSLAIGQRFSQVLKSFLHHPRIDYHDIIGRRFTRIYNTTTPLSSLF